MSFLFPIIALAAVILGIWLTGHLARKRRAGTGDYSLECPTDSANPPDRRIDFSGPLVRPTTAILKSQLARRVRATWRRSEQIDYAAFELDGVSIALRVSYRDSTAASPATPSAATTSTAARSAATAKRAVEARVRW